MEMEVYGAIKIKDGLFFGDETAAQDLEFIVTNKITHVINCSCKQLQNTWESIGVSYLSYSWNDNDTQIIYDSRDEVLNTTYAFIEDTLNIGDTVLVHSVKGQNRCVVIIAGYLMKKYRWSAQKAISFIKSKKPNIELRTNFFNQLCSLESKLTKMGSGPKTHDFYDIGEEKAIDSEELLLTNTFINTKTTNPNFKTNYDVSPKRIPEKIVWADETGDKKLKIIIDNNKIIKSLQGMPKPIKKNLIKSCIKGSKSVIQLKPEDINLTQENENQLTQSSHILQVYKEKQPISEKKVSLASNQTTNNKPAVLGNNFVPPILPQPQQTLPIQPTQPTNMKKTNREVKSQGNVSQLAKIYGVQHHINIYQPKPNQSMQSFFQTNNYKPQMKPYAESEKEQKINDDKENTKQKGFKITIKKTQEAINTNQNMPKLNGESNNNNKIQDQYKPVLLSSSSNQAVLSAPIIKKPITANLYFKTLRPDTSHEAIRPLFNAQKTQNTFPANLGSFSAANEENKNEDSRVNPTQQLSAKGFKMRGRNASPANIQPAYVFSNNFLYSKYDNKPRWKF